MKKKYRKGKVFEKHIYIKKLLSKIYKELITYRGFPDDTTGKEPACQCRQHETWLQSLGQDDPLEQGMATHSSILA